MNLPQEDSVLEAFDHERARRDAQREHGRERAVRRQAVTFWVVFIILTCGNVVALGFAAKYAVLPVLADYEAGLLTGKVALGWTATFLVVPAIVAVGFLVWVWSARPRR